MGFVSVGMKGRYNMSMQKASDKVIPSGAVEVVLRDGVTGKIKSVEYYKNTVVTSGKNSMADALRGTESGKGIITYCALGTNGTASAEANVKLGAELFRKLVSVRSVDGNVATFQTFFTTSEANGTLLEAGLFGDDASGTADSGTLFCRVTISRVKTSSDTLTLSWAVTIG